MFTARQIQNLKPKEKPYQVREGKGFGIRVFPSGEKVWVYAYKVNGKQRMISLGPYPELKLADARKAFQEARDLLVKEGVDPLTAKHDERQEPNLKEAVEIYLARAEKRGMRSIKEERRMLTRYIPRDWEHRKAKTIKRGEVREVLEDLAESAPQMANQFLKALHRFFGFCLDREYLEHNPCTRLQKPAPEVRKERWLSEGEIKAFWLGLESAGMSEEVKRALRLVLITAQRPGEVVAMRHDHIQGHWWTIPGDHAKNGLPHRVYLTAMALEIIGEGEGFVFPSPIKGKRAHLTRPSLTHALSLNHYLHIPYWTPHDLRRTAASHMTSMGIPRFEVAKILNHSDRSITAIYDRNSYDIPKQKAMEIWSRKIEGIITGESMGKVIPLSR